MDYLAIAACALITASGCRASPELHARPAGVATDHDVPPVTNADVAVAPVSGPAAPRSRTPAPGGAAAVADILDAAGDLKALALVRLAEKDGDVTQLIVSGMTDDGGGASCRSIADEITCVALAGFQPDHLARALARQDAPPVTPPAWAERILAIYATLPATDELSIEPRFEQVGVVLAIEGLGARYAIRHAGSWRVSEEQDGGKSSRPFFFGTLDTSSATGVPSIGLVLGGYTKEGGVRSETDHLVVMRIDDDALVEVGRVVVGRAAWFDCLGPRDRPLFDPGDPDHYLIRLQPTVTADGRVKLDVGRRHTPRKLRTLRTACGVELDVTAIDDLTRLVGLHRLDELLAIEPDDPEL